MTEVDILRTDPRSVRNTARLGNAPYYKNYGYINTSTLGASRHPSENLPTSRQRETKRGQGAMFYLLPTKVILTILIIRYLCYKSYYETKSIF